MIRRFFALALCAAFLPAPAAADTPPTIAELAADPYMQGPEISPNGQYIAAYSHREAGDAIHILRADDPSGANRRIELAPLHLTDFKWAGNDKLVLTVLAELRVAGTGQKVPSTRLVILDLKTGEAIVGDRDARGMMAGEILFIDEGGQFAIVASQNDPFEAPSVKRVDLSDGKVETIERDRNDVWDWAVDARGMVRAGIAVDGSKYRIYYRDRAGQDLQKIKGKIEDDGSYAIEDVHFGWQGDEAIVLSNKDSDTFAAYEFDFAKGELGRQVFKVDGADIEGVRYDPDYKVVGFRYSDDRPRMHWVDPDLAALQARLDRVLPDATNVIDSFSRDRNRVLVYSNSPTDPGTWYVLQQDTGQMVPMLQPYDRLKGRTLSPTRTLTYTARDGLSVPAYLTLPEGREAADLPLILMPHGGPYARDDWGYDSMAQLFASRGYAVLQPQFRGSTGRGRTYMERGFGQWGAAMQDDMMDGIAHLAAEGTIDPARVCIVGGSFGGYAAMWGALRDPDAFRCAASWAGVSDLEAAMRNTKRAFGAKRYYRQWRDTVRGVDEVDLKAVSPIHRAEQLRVPMLIAHGEDDQTVLVDQSKDFARKLDKAGIEHELVTYEDTGHNFDTEKVRADYMTRLIDFVTRHNPPS